MKKHYVKAASMDQMLKAFEGRIHELQGRESIESATSADMIDAFYNRIDELEQTEASTDVQCSSDLSEEERNKLHEIAERYVTSKPVSGDWDTELVHEQEAIANELDVTMEDAKLIMIEELGFDPAEWDVSSCSVTSSMKVDPSDESEIYEDVDGMFTGEPGSKVSLAEIKRYWDMNYDNDPVLHEEYAESDGEKWLKDTIAWMRPVDSSTDIHASEDYFGADMSNLLGDMIQKELAGKTISKRRDLADEPGGLVYEAKELGIDDFWDLLEALEGMCHEGRAREIDDSTYEILPADASASIKCAEDTQDVFMLMSYSSDYGAGMDGDEFGCIGKFYAPSLEDAVQEFSKIKEEYPHAFGDVDTRSGSSSYYIDQYNDYFDNGEKTYSDIRFLAADIMSGYEQEGRDLAYENGETPYN